MMQRPVPNQVVENAGLDGFDGAFCAVNELLATDSAQVRGNMSQTGDVVQMTVRNHHCLYALLKEPVSAILRAFST